MTGTTSNRGGSCSAPSVVRTVNAAQNTMSVHLRFFTCCCCYCCFCCTFEPAPVTVRTCEVFRVQTRGLPPLRRFAVPSGNASGAVPGACFHSVHPSPTSCESLPWGPLWEIGSSKRPLLPPHLMAFFHSFSSSLPSFSSFSLLSPFYEWHALHN